MTRLASVAIAFAVAAVFAAATSVVLAISTVSLTVSDLAARGGYGDWPV